MEKRGKRVRKRYLYRTLLFVAMISLLPVAVIGIMTNLKITTAINTELVEADSQILGLTANTVESVVGQMKNACVQLKNDQIFTRFHQLDQNISWYEERTIFGTDEELQQMYTYLSIKGQVFDRLYSETVTNEFVESVYYIDLKKKVILTSERKLYGLDEFYDQGLLPDLNAQIGSLGLVERTAANTISIFYGAKYQGDSQIFVMNLSPIRFYRYLTETVMNQTSSRLFILQNNGQLIGGPAPAKQAYEQISGELESYNKASVFNRNIRIGDVNYYLSGIFSDQLHWWIFDITKANELFEPSSYTMRIMVTACLTLAVLICIAILFWSVRWYRPIRRILEELSSHTSEAVQEESANEMTYIYDSLQHMHLEQTKLRERVRQMLPYFQEKYIQSLLRQDEIILEHVREKLHYLSIPLSTERICLMMFQVREEIREDSMGDMKNTVEQNICIQEAIREVCVGAGLNYFILNDLDKFTVIVNWERDGMNGLFQVCETCGEAIRAAAGLCYEAGISRVQPNITELPEAWREAQQALACSMFAESGHIAYIDDILFLEDGGSHKAFKIPLSIFAAIRAGKEEEAVRELLVFLKRVTLAYDHLSYERVSNLFLRLLSRLFDLVEEMEIQDEAVSAFLYQSNSELLNHNELLAMEAMKRAVERLARICGERLATKNEDRIAVIRGIIESGYSDSSLSLTEVAEKAGLHPDYLSRIFKEHTGQTFSEYLNQMRIEKSIALLRDTGLKIWEVGAAVGYNNANYFIKVFKEAMGVTPKEYRTSLQNMK